MPAFPVFPGGMANLFNFMMPFNIPREVQPDPAKAAELLASLPTVTRGLLRRVSRIVAAEEAEAGGEGESGWTCGICLDGVDEAETETHVKALPCNHLFHQHCLEPWFTTNHTW